MATPHITTVDLGGDRDLPLLLVGPSLGTAVEPLWRAAADRLADRWHVVGWDLPGHGTNRAVVDDLTMAELAGGVLAAVDAPSFTYAGDSVGGAVGLQLLLDAPTRLDGAALCCTGAKILEPKVWHDRATFVREHGTASQVDGSRQRWFGPGFVEREPAVADALLDSLAATETQGYVAVCEALAAFDVRDRLGEIAAPVTAIAGTDDVPTPPAGLQLVADGVQNGTFTLLDGVAHLAPAEAPDDVARLIRERLG